MAIRKSARTLVGSLMLLLPLTAAAAPPVTPAVAPFSRQERFALVGDIANARFTRLYIFDKKTQRYVDRFLISPGTALHPTTGTNFTVTRAIFRPTWTPPKSAWAANLKFQPAGINNPMGLLKLDLGGYSEFIHGVPKSEEANLGKAASHGCLRISTANVLYLFQHYAGAGTTVTINRNLALSNQWAAQFTAAGGKDHVITDGAELIPLVLSGKNPAVLEYHD